MTDRLGDEQVTMYTTIPLYAGWAGLALAREVQEWRALVNGGPCPKCEGTGDADEWGSMCGYCKGTGRLPGLIERLELDIPDEAVASVIADLRRMVTP